MRQYTIHFKDGSSHTILCDRFEIRHPAPLSHGLAQLVGEAAPKGSVTFIVSVGGKELEADIFVLFPEVAAIVPVVEDPSAPGFTVILRNSRLPVRVKATRFRVAEDNVYFFAPSPPDYFYSPIMGIELRSPSDLIKPSFAQLLEGTLPLPLPPIENVYVDPSEVMAIIPEDVGEGEAPEDEAEE